MSKTPVQNRPLYEIAAEIRADYASRGKPVYYAAKPYVDAMAQMDRVTEPYGLDPGYEMVLYALSNLQTWRGETARRVKAEMKAMLPW